MTERKIVIRSLHSNRKALWDYDVLQEYEAGIVLSGAEVKSVRAKSCNLKGSYVAIRGQEAWVIGMHVSSYPNATTIVRIDPKRDRKLLLRKRDILGIGGKQRERGMTIVPVEVYEKGNLIKVRVALARGRKKYDKKNILRERDVNREIDRRMKERDYRD